MKLIITEQEELSVDINRVCWFAEAVIIVGEKQFSYRSNRSFDHSNQKFPISELGEHLKEKKTIRHNDTSIPFEERVMAVLNELGPALLTLKNCGLMNMKVQDLIAEYNA